MPRIAAFVTPHGFGHAARTAAVLEALAGRVAGLEIEIWTTVPEWFFAESLRSPFELVPGPFDVGFVQASPVEEDLDATVRALDAFERDAEARAHRAADRMRRAGVDLVLADQCPLGLEAARRAGVRSILMESFTWDWIYEPLLERAPRLAFHRQLCRERLETAGEWIQLEPVCAPRPGSPRSPPVARVPRADRATVRQRLRIGEGERLVLVSLGGVEYRLRELRSLARERGCVFVVPGGADRETHEGNLRLLPHHSPVHHPDLVAAADLLVCKLGYSTVAEAWAAGTPLAYLPRPGFRESGPLAAFVARELPARELAAGSLDDGSWIEAVRELLAAPRPEPRRSGGAEGVAAFLAERLGT
jgi:UDP:flavonoid glycosyltransferase YjiC (YdhE family)